MPDTEQLHRLETLLGRVLVGGVILSASVLAIGLAVEVAGGNAHALLRAGLLVLMATPIVRVAVSLVEYVRMRDWFFTATTAAVLAVLLTGVVLAALKAMPNA
ncbi:MAG TPA: DUF1634 domain-containing protein [Vicinamibacterales bacterium]|nr:DUF1634 domain-containing protein [Vicinamibacterales bacterium]